MALTKLNQARKAWIAAAAMAISLTAMAGAASAETVATPPAQTPAATAPLSTEDFVQVMATVAAFEQRAGKLAQVLGQNNDVRRYGRDLADDNRTIQTLSQGLAAAKMEAPVVTTLPASQTDWLSSLHRIDDREFDRMFMDMQVQTQQEILAIVQTYAQSGDNAAVKALAAKLVPAVQQRLAQARAVLRVAG